MGRAGQRPPIEEETPLAKLTARIRDRIAADPIVAGVGAIVGLALLAGLCIVLFVSVWSPMRPIQSPLATPTVDSPTEASATSTPVATGTPRPLDAEEELHLPLIMQSARVTPTPVVVTPSPTPTPTPEPVDFAAVREELQAEGKDLAHVKIGFHTGPMGNARGLEDYLRALAQVGVPGVIKSVDDYGVIVQALRKSPDHVTIFRLTGGDLELPDYDLPARQAAEEHWARVMAALPLDFDRRTWLEVINEPDKARADWLGHFSHRTAQLALRDGYRLAAFGWSSGEPEPEDWQTPGMLAFLRLAAQHPDQIAVALHEYSYKVDDIAFLYPWHVGRFQILFQICDARGIARPTVLITEWGWTFQRVPPVDQAMRDIAWAAELYAAYPEVKGVAIWYLGGGYGGIADLAQRLILPLRYYVWSEYFVIEPGQKPTDPALFAPP